MAVLLILAVAVAAAWALRTQANAGALTASGTILIAAGLGWQGAGRQLLGVALLPVLAGRCLAALTIGAVGAWSVLSRNPRSLRLAASLLSIINRNMGSLLLVVNRKGRRPSSSQESS